jgi:glycogen operon protein
VRFTVPQAPQGRQWVLELYTADDARGPEPMPPGPFELTGRSLAALREVPRDEEP